jgi:hypothetical protein
MDKLTTDQKFGAIIQSLTKIESSIEELKAGQKKQDQILEKQNQLIELLSSRSVSQAGDIENLKWKQLETETTLSSSIRNLSTRSIELESEIKEIKDKDAS